MLLHLVDGTGGDAGEAYKTVRAELSAYGHGLAEKPEIVALNKADALSADEIKQQAARLKRAAKKPPLRHFRRERGGRRRRAAGALGGDRRDAPGRRRAKPQRGRLAAVSTAAATAATRADPRHPRPLCLD